MHRNCSESANGTRPRDTSISENKNKRETGRLSRITLIPFGNAANSFNENYNYLFIAKNHERNYYKYSEIIENWLQ